MRCDSGRPRSHSQEISGANGMSIVERLLRPVSGETGLNISDRFRHQCLRLRGDQRGASTVEFALVAVPFLALTCGTIEASIDYWAQSILQQAVSDAGRLVYTGKFQTSNANTTGNDNFIAAFRNEICKDNGSPRITIFNCSNVRINISQVDSFSVANPVSPASTDSSTGKVDWNPAFGNYACGKSSSIMVIQAAVDFPIFFNLIPTGQATLPGGKRILQAATVFRSEPFGSSVSC